MKFKREYIEKYLPISPNDMRTLDELFEKVVYLMSKYSLDEELSIAIMGEDTDLVLSGYRKEYVGPN